jgi:hypothetical protein
MTPKLSWSGQGASKLGVVAALAAWSTGCSGGPASPNPNESALTTAQSVQGLDADYVPFPHGKRIHKSCIHHLEPGAKIQGNGDIVVDGPQGRTVEHVPPCPYKPISPEGHALQANGNIEYEYAHPANSSFNWFNELEVGFNVPQPPSRIAIFQEQLALWSGLMSRANANIVLQPVLGYGIAAQGCGGPTWTDYQMLNYYIDQNGTAYCGSQTAVSPGQRIWSAVVLDTSQPCDNSGNNCSWGIGYSVDNGNTWIVNEAFDVPTYMDTALFASLEAYNVNDCGNFPSDNSMLFVPAVSVPGPQWNNFTWTGASNLTIIDQVPPPLPPGIPSNCGYGIGFTPLGPVLYY